MKKLLIPFLLLSGCSTSGVDRADQNEIIKEFYVSIVSMQQVRLSSQVKTGIAGGAAIGVIDELDGDHEDMIAGALAGALVGGLFTALFEGGDIAYEYKLKSETEGEFTLIQKEKINIESGCGKVHVSAKVTIDEALKVNCANNSSNEHDGTDIKGL